MLYPEIYIIKQEKKFIDILIYLKECFLILVKALSSYNSFVLFLKQKFHF